jgi:aspartate/methionine/tyrosine aminotransferase
LLPSEFRLVNWMMQFDQEAKYNLTSSGLPEPNLSAMGINTSFADFASEKDVHARLFAEAIAQLYDVEPENVVLTAGATEAIFLAYSVLGTGRKAVVPLPNYEPMFTVPTSLGMTLKHSLAGRLETRGAVYGLTDPNNPTAESLEPSLVERLLEACRKTGSSLYVNETYKEFTFPGRPVSLFQQHKDMVTCSTMTKFYGLGRLRVGWMLADKRTAHELLKAERLVTGHIPEYSLWIARQVLNNRERFVERARGIYDENLALVAKFAREIEGVAETRLGGAPFCLVKYERGPDSVSFGRKLLKKTGVLVSPGEFFGAPKAFRLCFTCNKAVLRQGLGSLAEYLTDSKAG